MQKFSRNFEPTYLAENLAARGDRCPIPATHDRLFEVHHWWHEMARWYHEPDPFRYGLGAFIQAARSVTFMLQTEKAVFKDFDWYDQWVASAKNDPILKWLLDTRNAFVHQQALTPHSSLKIRCLEKSRDLLDVDEVPLVIEVSPFMCTHYYMEQGPHTDHAHEYTRMWSMEGLAGRELLEVTADIYDRLDDLVCTAHQQVGTSMTSHQKMGSARALPCMENVSRFHVVRTSIKNGKEIWINEPPGLHHH